MLTSEEYAEKGGTICPFCGSDEIEGGQFDVDGPRATQEVSCLACDATWFTYYKLAGFYVVSE